MGSKLLAIFLTLLQLCRAGEDDCPRIIGRRQWSVVDPKSVNYLIIPVPYVVVHHTVTPECSTRQGCADRVESIRSYHMDTLGWNDIGYSFLIGGDGNVYEGTGWSHEGAHTYGYNKKSLGIAFIGNFQEKAASSDMVDAAHKLILCGKSKGYLRQRVGVIGARQVSSTISPGIELYDQIQNWPEWVSTVERSSVAS